MALMDWLTGGAKKKGPNRSAIKDVDLKKLRMDQATHDSDARMAAKKSGAKPDAKAPDEKKVASIGAAAAAANNDKTKSFWKNTYEQIHKKKK